MIKNVLKLCQGYVMAMFIVGVYDDFFLITKPRKTNITKTFVCVQRQVSIGDNLCNSIKRVVI